MKHLSCVLSLALLLAGCGTDASDPEGAPAKGDEPSREGEAPPTEPGSGEETVASPGGEIASADGEVGATETNVAAAPCLADVDCPDGVRCVAFGDAGSGPGFCDVQDVASP